MEMTDIMLNDEELLAAYAQGFGTSHLAGLQAVQAAVVASIPAPEPAPAPDPAPAAKK